jgi:ABC-2 type transport system permease protein
VRGDRRHAARLISGLVLLAVATVAACVALSSLTDAATDVVLVVTVLAGSAVTLGFALAPIIGGVGDPLDPRRFALLGLPRGPLTAALAIAAFVSVPTLALTVVAVCAGVVWSAHSAPAAVAALSVLLGVATCVLLAHVCMALTALFLRERRSRELSGLFVLALLVVVVPVGVFLASLEWDGAVPTQLTEAVAALALTPVGAAWALPGLTAEGAPGSPAVGIVALIAVATLALLAAAWVWVVHRLLTTAERPIASRERAGLGWFAVAPGTPTGAVAARSLQYWFRDRRYLVNLLIIPVAAALITVPLLLAGVPPTIVALVPVPFAALFLGWLPHNDLAYDSTAVWMHFSSGIRGAADRLGRLVPVLLIGLPLLAIAIPVAISVHGRWAMLPAMTGLSACLFFSALGLSSVSSVVAPYAVSRPGESPFQQPQRTGASGAIAQGVVLFGALAVSAPVLWWSYLSLTRDVDYAMTTLWAGLAIGLTVFLVGIAAGGVVFDRREGRLMEFAETT